MTDHNPVDHTVLVVDDEPASLRALRRTLAPEYRVLCAAAGAEALALLASRPVSLLVTDHRMPGMSGVELLARSAELHPEVVRIVLTGHAEVDSLIQAINAGEVFYYLTKPWEPRDLALAVRRGIERLDSARERQRLLGDLQVACARARREAESKSRMLATAAHELGTPVHLAGNAVDLLGGIPAARASQWLAMAERALSWLERSLAQMSAAVRSTDGLELRLRPLEVCGSLAGVLEALRAAAAHRRLEMRWRAEGRAMVHGDPRWLRELWMAILSNAVRFTADGGAVEVAVDAVEGAVEVAVRDSGIGMTAEQLEAAFEPFSTAAGDLLLHTSGRLDFGARGMGLGLAMARAIAERHGGTIVLESAPGEGSCCRVRLPVLGAAPRR